MKFSDKNNMTDARPAIQDRLIIVGSLTATCKHAVQNVSMMWGETVFVDSIANADLCLLRNSDCRDANDTCVLIHCTHFADIFEDLLTFRERRRGATVVVASKDLKSNDLSIERGMVCDASIVNPYTETILMVAIIAAVRNQSTLRERLMYHWCEQPPTNEHEKISCRQISD